MLLAAVRALLLSPLLERYVNDVYGPYGVSVCSETGGAAMAAMWGMIAGPAPGVLAFPRMSKGELTAYCSNGCKALEGTQVSLVQLPPSAPMPGLVLSGSAAAAAPAALSAAESALIVQRQQEWVDRVLAPGPLRLCPYTASSAVAGSGLEALGVRPAPIAYHVSSAEGAPQLMADFWGAVCQMLESGEEGTSSIILSAPGWDGRWEAWRDEVFPLLESGVLAAGLGRTLGIVCFHPGYTVPSPMHLARNRFGHMRSLGTLRGWLREHAPALEGTLSEGALASAAEEMRRTPNAVINVLWSRQLEVAEAKRRSSLLYATNLARILALKSQLEQNE